MRSCCASCASRAVRRARSRRARAARRLVARAARRTRRRRSVRTVDYVFDCRKDGAARRDRDRYLAYPNLRGVSAQGSEDGFGVPFVGGVNAAAMPARGSSTSRRATRTRPRRSGGAGRSVAGGARGQSISSASAAARTSAGASAWSAPAWSAATATPRTARTTPPTPRPCSPPRRHAGGHQLGRHHAQSADARGPLRRAARVPRSIADLVEDLRRARGSRRPAKFDSNRVFELGRRYGFQGRLYAHAVVVASDLHASGLHRSEAGRSSRRRGTRCCRRWRRFCCRRNTRRRTRSCASCATTWSRAGCDRAACGRATSGAWAPSARARAHLAAGRRAWRARRPSDQPAPWDARTRRSAWPACRSRWR